MISALVAIKMQLMAKYTVVNCCSSFHRMMIDMLRSGCGAVAKPEFRCLQEMEDAQYQICCSWDDDERCVKVFDDFQDKFNETMMNFA
jgi:hypothetical protein